MNVTERGSSIAAYRKHMGYIHGSLGQQDTYVFEVFDELQGLGNVNGDLLEIGVYQGQSAILLGFLRRNEERLHVSDPFVGPSAHDPDFLKGSVAYYQSYSRELFETNYLRFHDDLPCIHVCSSLDLYDRLEPASFRFIHIDGSHRREVIRSDIALAQKLLVEGGIIAFNNYRTTATLEHSAAVWKEVANNSLTPLCATESELYLTGSSRRLIHPEELIARLRAIPSLTVVSPLFGDTIVPMVRAQTRPSVMIFQLKSYIPPILWHLARRLRRRLVP